MEDSIIPDKYEIYTDGSHSNGVASWAFVVVLQPKDISVHEAYGIVEDKFAVWKLWNVAGEIKAATQAIKWAVNTKTKVDIISDYEGIQGWAADWKTNNPWTAVYSKFAKENKIYVSEFKYVKAHSKNKWNDYVDELAKNHLKKETENE
jgi:ribonuclease HI